MAAGRRPDETALTDITILRSDNARMKRMCEQPLRGTTVKELARKLIHYGVEHIEQVEAWYGELAKKAGEPQPGDELAPD
jgi:hypothetical protein